MKYDATLKKLFQRPPNVLLSHVLGENIVVKRILPSERITIGNLHPDMLFETVDGQLLHTEIQGYSMREFACRNLLYFALVLRDYKRPPTQIVFWIGDGAVGVTGGLDVEFALHYQYRVIDVRKLDPDFLLHTPNVNEAIFAVLCKLSDQRATVQFILKRIAELPVVHQREALTELLILSGLRGLTSLVKAEARSMPVTFDIHDNEFLEGIYQDGSLDAARSILLAQLQKKFAPLPAAVAERVQTADLPTIQRWSLRVLDTTTLDDVFAE